MLSMPASAIPRRRRAPLAALLVLCLLVAALPLALWQVRPAPQAVPALPWAGRPRGGPRRSPLPPPAPYPPPRPAMAPACPWIPTACPPASTRPSWAP